MPIPSINSATVQPMVVHQLIGRWKNLAVGWKRISKNKPSGSPFAIFKVLQEAAIECTSDPTRDCRLIKLQGGAEVRLPHFVVPRFKEASGYLNDLADFPLDGHINAFRHKIRNRLTRKRRSRRHPRRRLLPRPARKPSYRSRSAITERSRRTPPALAVMRVASLTKSLGIFQGWWDHQ